MPTMTWEEKLWALNSLGNITLSLRGPGDWLIQQGGVELKDPTRPGVLIGINVTGAESPEQAVEEYWSKATQPRCYLVVDATSRENRKAYRWNHFMWAQIVEP